MRAKELLQETRAGQYKLADDTISLGNYTKKTTSGPTQPSWSIFYLIEKQYSESEEEWLNGIRGCLNIISYLFREF